MMKFRTLLFASFVGIITVLPYIRTFNQGVVCIDDYTYVVEHAEINGGIPSGDIKWMFTNTGHAIFMPLTWFSYLVDCEIARHLTSSDSSLDEREAVRFRVMHIHSTLLHGINTMLVFLFLLLVVRGQPNMAIVPCMAAALFWGLHPLRVESVAWIASRKDLVSFFWLALSLLSWVRWRIRQGDTCTLLTFHYWFSLVALIIGALGKPSVMIFPGLAILVDLLLLKKVQIRKDAQWNFQALGVYVLPVLLGLAIAVEATVFQNVGMAMNDPTPTWARVLNAFVSYGVYLKNTVWPVDLALQCIIRYPHPPRYMIPGLMIFAGCMWYIYSKLMEIRGNGFRIVKTDLVFSGLLWFFGSFIPFIGILGFGYHAYADRFTYIPSIGLSFVLLGCVTGLRRSQIVQFALLLASFALIPLTVRQLGFWKDEETVWKRTIEVDGEDNFVANVCLAQHAYDVHHNVKASLRYFDRAYSSNPDFTTSFGTMYMNALSEAGEKDKAYEFFKYYRDWNKARMEMADERAQSGAIVWGEDFAAAHIAMLLAETNFMASAEQELNELLVAQPRNMNAHYLEGRLAKMRGDLAGALRAWRQTLDCVEPSNAFARYRFLKKIIDKGGGQNGLE